MHDLNPSCGLLTLASVRSQSSPKQGYLPAPGINAESEMLGDTSQQWFLTHRDLSKIIVGQRQLRQVWRDMKFVGQNPRHFQKLMIMETQAEQQRFWDTCPSRDISTGLGEMLCPAASARAACPQSCRSTSAGHGRTHVPQSVATSPVSPRCLPAADVPPVLMDSGQIGFLYCAGAINSTQCCPAIL